MKLLQSTRPRDGEVSGFGLPLQLACHPVVCGEKRKTSKNQ
jgi:hypothetical protein